MASYYAKGCHPCLLRGVPGVYTSGGGLRDLLPDLAQYSPSKCTTIPSYRWSARPSSIPNKTAASIQYDLAHGLHSTSSSYPYSRGYRGVPFLPSAVWAYKHQHFLRATGLWQSRIRLRIGYPIFRWLLTLG